MDEQLRSNQGPQNDSYNLVYHGPRSRLKEGHCGELLHLRYAEGIIFYCFHKGQKSGSVVLSQLTEILPIMT